MPPAPRVSGVQAEAVYSPGDSALSCSVYQRVFVHGKTASADGCERNGTPLYPVAPVHLFTLEY
ncbi:hypothetical protein A8H39_27615 [Paraburkholderia fungorum]|nr:hypothetical protein KBK24_0136540 [Burkholderia sp. K24]PNE52478.1 hypothetical protein A8H39_27615 [Paraburkholderia fungorum]PZR43457.1 MAG: hypothetical protein DI523_27675 [Paraburkholderia fungorum]QLD51369.1 hypothetical protein C9419_20110 [Paraburkholderia fungorum]